jgi:hypothetical protein
MLIDRECERQPRPDYVQKSDGSCDTAMDLMKAHQLSPAAGVFEK